jgi:glycosyltransferase involved in cell wall biosynthesis
MGKAGVCNYGYCEERALRERDMLKSGVLVFSADLRPSLSSILEGLCKSSLLAKVVTTIAINPDSLFGRFLKAISVFLPRRWSGGVKRRFLPDFLKTKVETIYFRELLRLSVGKLGSEILSQRVWLWAELGFDRRVARRYGGIYSCVYGMEHSSCETFTRQKEKGGLCILRQVTAHGRHTAEIAKGEADKFPEYNDAFMRLFFKDMQRSLARKEKEYQLADLIVANSNFAKETFVSRGIPAEKVVVVPTGCPVCTNISANAGRGDKPLVFLFVGRMSLRKGIPYLIKAWHLLRVQGKAELWLVGAKEIPNIKLQDPHNGIRYFGVLSPQDLAKIYAQADVFVLPTLLEGLAYVLLEALSYGLPIITTGESGVGDFVQTGENGFIVDASCSDALIQAMAWCLGHRQELKKMGELSREKARSWTTSDSDSAHLKVVSEFLEKKGIK